MSQPNVKELEALIKMLRRHGVSEFEGHGLKMRIDTPLPQQPKNGTTDKVESEPTLSDEDIMLWSAGN